MSHYTVEIAWDWNDEFEFALVSTKYNNFWCDHINDYYKLIDDLTPHEAPVVFAEGSQRTRSGFDHHVFNFFKNK